MVRVKICGITNVDDAKTALDCGADALGFVFAESPRKVVVEEAKKIVKAIGPWVGTVGVFVNEKIENVLRTAAECKLSCIQLHGDEDPAYVKKISGYKVIKTFRVGDAFDWGRIKDYDADAFLFDAKVEGKFGGTGKSFDWGILKSKKFDRPVIISGGLNADNVKEAVRALAPYGVEASSGVEKIPGKKDPRLVGEFIKNAKEN